MDATRSSRTINRRAAAGVAACVGLVAIAFGVGRCTAPVAAGLEPEVAGFSAVDIGPGADFTTAAGAAMAELGAYLDSVTTTTMTPPVMPLAASAPTYTGPVSDDCWIGLAREIGWPEDTLGTLQRIIRRESGCDPNAYANRPSTLDNSRGLLQINAYGSLADGIRRLCGIEPETLFDPTVNLACGLTYYQSMGWRPWGGGA